MEEKIVSLKVNDNIDKTIAATKSLKAQLREAVAEVQQLSEKYGESSEQAVQAAKRAAGLKDRIEDANDAVQAFKGEGAFLATSKAIGAAASGLAAVQGGLGLIGVEGENVEKTILKVQSAMALSQGLAGLEDAGRSFKQMGVVAAQALKGIRTGIAATGIGVLLVALGAVVAYWDDIKEAVSGVSEEQKELNKLSKEQLDAEQKKLETIDAQDNVLKLQGKTEKEILALKQKQVTGVINLAKADITRAENLKKLELAAAERNFKILKQITTFAAQVSVAGLRIIATPLDILIKTANAVSKVLGFGEITAINLNEELTKLAELGADTVSKFVFNPEEVAANGDAAIATAKDRVNKLLNQQAGYILQSQAIDKEAANKKAADNKTAEEKALAAEKKREQDFLDNLTKQGQAAKDANDAFLDEQKSANEQLNALKDANIARDANDLLVRGQMASTDIAIAGNTYKAKKELSEAAVKVAEEEFAARQKLNDATVAGLMVVSDLVGRETGKGKALAVAASLINTYSAIAGQLKAFAGVPIPGYAIVQAITTGLAGFAAVKNILKVQVPNGGGGGGGATPAPSSMGAGASTASAAPQFNVVGTSGALASQVQSVTSPQAPIKAFVVSNDVTTAQSLDRNIVKSATLG
jgi:hypothetical protein